MVLATSPHRKKVESVAERECGCLFKYLCDGPKDRQATCDPKHAGIGSRIKRF